MIFIKQKQSEPWKELSDRDLHCHMGILSPLVVGSQEEKNYLEGMRLMLGYHFDILLDGVDENKSGMPPTLVKVELS